MKFRSASFNGEVFNVTCPYCSTILEVTEEELDSINTQYGGAYPCEHSECRYTITFPDAKERTRLKAGHVIENEKPPQIELVETVENQGQPAKEITCPKCEKEHLKSLKKCPFCKHDRKKSMNAAKERRANDKEKKSPGFWETVGSGLLSCLGLLALVIGVFLASWQIPRLAGCISPEIIETVDDSPTDRPNPSLENQKHLTKIKPPFSDSPQ